MTWESPRHLMRCPRVCPHCTTVEELIKYVVVSSPYVISGAYMVANLRSSNFGDSNVLDLLHTCPIATTAWPRRFSAYQDARVWSSTGRRSDVGHRFEGCGELVHGDVRALLSQRRWHRSEIYWRADPAVRNWSAALVDVLEEARTANEVLLVQQPSPALNNLNRGCKRCERYATSFTNLEPGQFSFPNYQQMLVSHHSKRA